MTLQDILKTLDELEARAERTLDEADRTVFKSMVFNAYPLLREEIKRLQAEVELLKHPLPSPKEEKEFYEKAYHICNTGCGYGCTKGL